MAWYCDLALIVGLTLSVCEAEDAGPEALPPDDPGAWAFRPKPEPPPPAPSPPAAAAPAPNFGPVIVEKVAYVRSPPRAPASLPPSPPPAPPAPDYARIGAEAAYAARVSGPLAWPETRASRPAPAPAVSAPAGPGLGGLAGAAGAGVPAPEGSAYEERSRTSSLPVDNSRIVTTDRYISGILEGGVNSQLSGGEDGGEEVVIQVNRDVFGYHGRNVLIPKGSRLVCGFRTPKQGESRLGISCGRVLLGGSRAEIYQAGAGGFDVQGRRGVAGEVDNRFWERYGTAFVLAGISAAVRASSAAVGTGGDDEAGYAERGAEELGERLGEITAAVLEETVNLAPIVTLAQGTRVTVRPARDWYIRRVGDERMAARSE